MRQPLGQHFLHDGRVIKSILAAAELKPNDTVLEIGPGKGALTEGLVAKSKQIIAVELDARLGPALALRFQHRPRFTLVPGDILKVDLDIVVPPAVRPVKVLGNLPYSITSPIFEKLMRWPAWETGVFLIQKEVAERIASAPGSRSFGILSLAVQLFAEPELLLTVPPAAFSPPPDVHSQVLRLRRKKEPGIPPDLLPDFFDLAHGAFAHRRKTIANSLAFHTGLARSAIESWLLRQGISPSLRAETLGTPDYAKLAVAWSVFRRETKLT